MDKFFIQNAFKTLDEIEAEIKVKKNLNEDLEKKEPVCEDYDLDELSDKYIGLGCTVASKDAYADEHGTIQSLKDFEGDFEKSIWTVALDIGIMLNIEGKDIKVDLEEKLPKDLANAYARTENRDSNKFVGFTSLPKNYGRRASTRVDYDAATYVEISKEEALKNYSKKGMRNKLRVIIMGHVMRWDDNNYLISAYDWLPSSISRNSFSDIINNASKIYVTDEDTQIINRPAEAESEPEELEVARQAQVDSRYSYNWDKSLGDYKKINRAANSVIDASRGVKDTGNHRGSPKWIAKQSYDYRLFKDYRRTYADKLKEVDAYIQSGRAESDPVVQRAREYAGDYFKLMNGAEKRYSDERNRRYAEKRDERTKQLKCGINFKLALLIIYKYLANKAKKNFMDTHSDASDEYALENHRYNQLSKRLDELNAYLERITDEIAKTKAELTPELEADYLEKKNDSLERLGDEYEGYLSKIAELTGKSTTEGLHEDVEKHIRIYTVDQNDVEDFANPDEYDVDKAVEYAKSLMSGGKYKHVVAVSVINSGDDEKIEDLWDSADESAEDLDETIKDKRSIGEIIDDKLKNESLTEAKKFNIKDKDEMIDAKVYQKVGDKTNDDLVVVDPSVESENQESEPKVGDAILQCKECKTSIFKDVDSLVEEEDDQTYNIGDACPHCGAKSGYLYIGQVAKKDAEDAKEESDKPEDAEEVAPIVDENDDVSLEPVEDNSTDLNDVDEIKEESFDKLVNPYLTKLYENVESFRTTKVAQTGRNKLMVEGIITGKNKKELSTQFLFTIKENKDNSIVFEGYNKLLTEQKDSFQLKASCENNSLLFESLSYKYNKNNQLIEGLEENK